MHNYLIISGGSRGIGEKTIALFMQHDWKIINISRSPSALTGVININANLTDPAWPQQHAAAILEKIKNAKQICLVHNAASFKRDNVVDLSAKDLREVLEINIVAPTILNQLCIPHMQVGSSIIYIGTTLAEQAVSNRASYVTSKHAIVGLMRATCQDLIGKNITTCCICPGFVNTTMLTNELDHATLQSIVKQKVTMGRLIEPQEIAELIYFCATHPVINGEVIHANLGQIMT